MRLSRLTPQPLTISSINYTIFYSEAHPDKIVNLKFRKVSHLNKFTFVAVAMMGLVSSSFGQDYVYQFSTSISGYQEVGASDLANYGAGGFPGTGFYLNFGTLSETVYYDPVANTLRQVGSFTIATTSENLSFNDPYSVSGGDVAASVLVAYTFNRGSNMVSFDTGAQSLNGDPTSKSGASTSSGNLLNWTIPYTATCTFTTGGKDYYGSFSGTFGVSSGTAISTYVSQLTASSLVLQQSQGPYFGSPHPGTSIAADNGLTASIANYVGDGTLYHQYDVGPVTATSVPEPGSAAMLGFGAGLLAYKFARRTRRPGLLTPRTRSGTNRVCFLKEMRD